jgi:hypothetical protein
MESKKPGPQLEADLSKLSLEYHNLSPLAAERPVRPHNYSTATADGLRNLEQSSFDGTRINNPGNTHIGWNANIGPQSMSWTSYT